MRRCDHRLRKFVSPVSVNQCKEDHGLNQCLKAIDLPESTYYYRIERRGPSEEDQKRLMTHIRAIIRDHPAAGIPAMGTGASSQSLRSALESVLTINGSDGFLAIMNWLCPDRCRSKAPRRYRRFWRRPPAN